MSNSQFVWFQLYDSKTGLPFKGTTTDKVFVSDTADVADFRDAVQIKYDKPLYLKDVASSSLLVFKNKSSFDKRNLNDEKEEPLEVDSSVANLGISKKEALIVVVNSPEQKQRQELPRPISYGKMIHIAREMLTRALLFQITDAQTRLLVKNLHDEFLKWAEDPSLGPNDARILMNRLNASIKSETAVNLKKQIYFIEGFVGKTRTLIYKVVQVGSFEVKCGKLYSLADNQADALRELSVSEAIHKERKCSSVVHYENSVTMTHRDGVESLLLIMPLFPMSMEEVIDSMQVMDDCFFVWCALWLLDAGKAFYEAGYAHCDIKPHNCMMGQDRIVLIDLGAATKLGEIPHEATRGYFLDASLSNPVDGSFDVKCIISTLCRCGVKGFFLMTH